MSSADFPTQHAASPAETRFDLLILGASFAGLEVYYQLRRSRVGRELSVCLVDRQPEHGYIPLVQERLVDRIDPASTRLPTQRVVARDPRARYVCGEVIGLRPDNPDHVVLLSDGSELRGASLVIALGSVFRPPPGLPGGEQLLGYKFEDEFSVAHTRLRERARSDQPVVVIGGGVSGVELAGELAHRAIGGAEAGARGQPAVTLIESGDRLLRGLSAGAGRAAQRRLQAQGVRVVLDTRVAAVSSGKLRLEARGGGDAGELAFGQAFWAAGVRPSPLLAQLGLPLTQRGYLRVRPSLRCDAAIGGGEPAVFACGDAVRVVDAGGEWPTMQRAIECLWQAKVVARNLLALRLGRPVRTHKLVREFPYGVSIGARSLVVYRSLWVDLGRLGIWFRRFLMRQYFKRYCG